MLFDPEAFGIAMGELIREAVEPLQAEIASLKKALADMPSPAAGKDGAPGRDGKDCDMAAVKSLVDEAVRAVPVIHGKDGKDGRDGKDGAQGERGENGADGIGAAGAMIDRDGALVLTMTNGEVRSLGAVVGKDGRDGTDGKDGRDGIGLESFDLEYLDETHEIRVKASCAGRVKEVRYPAGGIRPAGYWREGTKAQAGEVFTHDGSGWVAKSATTAKPSTDCADWVLIARKGRDGERGQKGQDGAPPAPIKLAGGYQPEPDAGPSAAPPRSP